MHNAFSAACFFAVPARRPRDIVIAADSSNSVNWAAVIAFIKQIVAAFKPSPEGTRFAFVTYADGSNVAFGFPLGTPASAQYNTQVVQRFFDAARRSTGTRRNINLALRNVLMLFTQKALGSRPNARKVSRISCWTIPSVLYLQTVVHSNQQWRVGMYLKGCFCRSSGGPNVLFFFWGMRYLNNFGSFFSGCATHHDWPMDGQSSCLDCHRC